MLAFIPSFMLIATILSSVNAVAITLPNVKQGLAVGLPASGAVSNKVAVIAPAVPVKPIVPASKSHVLGPQGALKLAPVNAKSVQPVLLQPKPAMRKEYKLVKPASTPVLVVSLEFSSFTFSTCKLIFLSFVG